MFDISTKLVSEQDEISGLELFGWGNHSWIFMSLIGDKRVINLQRTKVYIFSDSVLCLSSKYRNFDRIDGESIEFEWNFPGFNTLQLSEEVKRLLLVLGETPENVTGRILFMSMFNDISRGSRDNEKECLANARIVSLYMRKDLELDNDHLLVLVLKKEWYSISEDSAQGEWDTMAERMLLEFAESGCPIFRATSPLSRGQLKSTGHGKLSIHYCADLDTIQTVFRTLISVNQHSLYGAVAEMCEE